MTSTVIDGGWLGLITRESQVQTATRRLGLHCRLYIAEIFLNSVNTRSTFVEHILGNRQENVVNSSYTRSSIDLQ